MRVLRKLKNKVVNSEYLGCEHRFVFEMLTFLGGFYGAFTYNLKGGIFCNAQTVNILLAGKCLGEQRWNDSFYYILPICAYLLGTIFSEILGSSVRKHKFVRWDTILVFFEIIAVTILANIPKEAPYQITQLSFNFICSMQYNTFRRANNIPIATVFCTNSIRQVGIALVKIVKHKDKSQIVIMNSYLITIFFFLFGCTVSTFLSLKFEERSLLFTLFPLSIVFLYLLYSDLGYDKNKFDIIPKGHQ